MPLGTLDRTPPPFFKQGLSARTKLVFFAALSVFLMAADSRLQLAAMLREGLAVALLPAQRVLQAPVRLLGSGADYLQGLSVALEGQRLAQAALVAQAEKAARADRLQAENQQLRELLAIRPMLPVRAVGAEVMHEAADPYSRKLFVSAGLAQGVRAGSPVINEHGVLGQVTRVYPLSAEVTLLADKEASIPVLNVRTQQRHAAFGGVEGPDGAQMDLRFVSGNADVQSGDLLHTSGVDGVYPPALPVARVVSVERRVDSSFARVLVAPLAVPDAVRHVLILEPVQAQGPASPGAAASAPAAPSRAAAPRPAAPASRPGVAR